MTAALKNAIDFLHTDCYYKPVGFVSYGGISAGTRVQMAKQVVTTLKMFPLAEAVSIPFVAEFIDEDGELQPNEVMDQAAAAVLDELARVAGALAPLRAVRGELVRPRCTVRPGPLLPTEKEWGEARFASHLSPASKLRPSREG
jgi:NAD(P)H-dependent FMN reductase